MSFLIKSTFIASLLCSPLLLAAGISRIAVTDTHITVQPEAGTSGFLKIVAIEPYDSYQSHRNWTLGTNNNGGLVDFNREGSARFTFTQAPGPFDPWLENTTDLIEASKSSHLAMRVKVDHFIGTIPARAIITGEGSASADFTITADGTWQIARLDLSTVTGTTTWTGQRTLRLDFPEALTIAGYENAEISIDWIAVTNKPAFSDPFTSGRWDRFWDLGYQPAAIIADVSSPITIDRFDGQIDRYYQKFQLVDEFTPVGKPHWVDDFSGLSYRAVTDHGFAPAGPGAGPGSIENGIYRMGYANGSPFDPQLATNNQEITGGQTRYLHARVRMTGYTGSSTTLSAAMYSTASGVAATTTAFNPDGDWQILHFDMATDPDWGGNENVRLDIPNNSGISASGFLGAILEVDWISANDDPLYDGTGNLGGYEVKYDFEINRLETRLIPLKGRQGVDSFAPAEFATLGTDVGKLNVTLNNLVQHTGTPRVRWKHDGLVFGINPDRLNATLDQVAVLGGLGINTYLTMLNQSNDTLVNDPQWPFINTRSSDQAPNNLYAFNTGDAYGLRYTRAVMEYAAHRMAQPGICPSNHWIYGNEVDAHWSWHNLGLIPAAGFRDYFAVEFRQAALVLAKYHPEFRVLLSHTHHWTSQIGTANQGMPSKSLIDELNTQWKSEGNFAWELASHPYPQSLFTPSFWNDTQATLDFNTTKITYKNYEVLPVYFQRDELLFNGRQRGISLTEQGFHTPAGTTGPAIQAAAYAYHWHRFNRIPGIKADILHRFTDHPDEGGLALGILDLTNTPKEIHQAFAVADTPDWRTTFDNYLPLLPFGSWDDPSSIPAWTVLDLPFDEPGFTHGWQGINNVTNLGTNAAGNLTGTASGSDPQIGNNNFFALERGAERFLVRMKVNSGSRGEIYWGTQANNNYQSVRKITWTTHPDDIFHTYDVDTLDHPDWNEQLIRRFRLDPTNVGSGGFEIDYILTGKRGDFDNDGIADDDEGIATMRDSNADAIPDFADATTAADDYDYWRLSNNFTSGVDTTPGGDADGDGVTNFEEYIFGLDPSDGRSSNPIVSPPDRRTGIFRYTRRNPVHTGLGSYRIMTSTDLLQWTHDASASQSTIEAGDNQVVTVTITPHLLAGPELFVRVSAQ